MIVNISSIQISPSHRTPMIAVVTFKESLPVINPVEAYTFRGLTFYPSLNGRTLQPLAVDGNTATFMLGFGDGPGEQGNETGQANINGVFGGARQSLDYYLNLFTSQYRLSIRLNAWQLALMQPLNDLTVAIAQVNAIYDLTFAVGVQLDVIGELLGQSRTVPFQPSGGVSPILDDATYRLLLYATLAKNNWDGKTASLYPIWKSLFPFGLLIINDNQNMTATIIVAGTFTSIETDLIVNGFIVPRPEGVLYNSASGTKPFFGFDVDTTEIAGFDTGHFV